MADVLDELLPHPDIDEDSHHLSAGDKAILLLGGAGNGNQVGHHLQFRALLFLRGGTVIHAVGMRATKTRILRVPLLRHRGAVAGLQTPASLRLEDLRDRT